MEELSKRNWVGTWAFKLNEAAAGREGYDRTRLEGEFSFGDVYPGCPHCKGASAYQCSCEKLSCWSGASNEVRCPWCNTSATVTGSATSLRAGGDA
jgi:hypothetical protein